MNTHTSTPRGVRLFQVYPLPEENIKTDVDIIAIHGLDTKSPDTWTWKSGKHNVNWLSDKDMLPSKVKSARIFMCDWPSDLFEHSGYTQKTLDEFARLLLSGIAARPGEANDTKHKERPILFIASCLGGIILMKALVRDSPGYHSVQRSVRGIVFLATPFSGTSFRDVAEWALPGLKAWAFIRAEKVSNLLYETKSNSELVKLRRDFTGFCKDNIESLCMAAFYETGKTSLPRKLIPWLPALLAQKKPLVSEESATLDVIHDPLPLERTHVLMNKFSGPSDDQYKVVASRVQSILEKIRQGRIIDMADAYINNTCYEDGNLRIQRISGESLPMERCYINLVIIEHSTKNTPENQDSPQFTQFSLYSRLDVQTLDDAVQVDPWHLFDERKGDAEHITKPRRILIRGHAGVGKSTFCKKIVHDFKKLKMWHDLFTRILWVPLRNLKRLEKAKCNLEAMLYEVYFSQTSQGRQFASELWTELEANKYKETLFILDGLDEVYGGLEKDSYLFNLLQTLLNLPAVIVTSRPHVSLVGHLEMQFDLELETIGFYPDQVKSYVEGVLVIPGDQEPDRRKIEGLHSLLQKHQLLRGLVQIPIQLDALCYIWSEDSSIMRDKYSLETMTGIYQAIVKRLWKKDILRLGKKDGGVTITKQDIHDAHLKVVEGCVPGESYFLQKLAFTGMVNDKINFHNTDCENIQDESSKFLPARILPHLSFLRTSNPSSRDSAYHFLHLTFQEYFAARYFVRQWKTEKRQLLNEGELVETFLTHHKYDGRYDIFWRFVAGLLSLEGEKLGEFFQLIADEPLDLIGPVHQRLVMHCLSEVPLDKVSFSAQRGKLECQLGRWLVFECEFTGTAKVARAMEFPEKSLSNALESASGKHRRIIVQSLRHRPAIPPLIIRLVCSWLRANVEVDLKGFILAMLAKHQASADNEVFEAVVACLGDTSVRVQNEALKTLESWSPLRKDILDAVMAQAIDQNSPIHKRATRLLGKQPQLDSGIIDALITELEDERGLTDVHFRTIKNRQVVIIEALAHQPQRREEILHAISMQLTSGEELVRNMAIESLKNQPGLSDDVFQTITTLLMDSSVFVREAVLEVLGGWPQPNDEVLDKILGIFRTQLKDEDPIIRKQVFKMLKGLPRLDQDTLRAIKAGVQNKYEEESVWTEAVGLLINQKQLDDGICNAMITEWLHDEEMPVRHAALAKLARRPRFTKEIVDIAVAQIEDCNPDIQYFALKALQNQPQLSDTVLETIAKRLNDSDKYVRQAAVDTLANRPQLRDNVIDVIAARLADEGDREIRKSLLRILSPRPKLDDNVLYAVARLLKHDLIDTSVLAKTPNLAADVLRGQPQPNDNVINAIIKHLDTSSGTVREATLRAIGGWSQLSEQCLVLIAKSLGDESSYSRPAAFYALTNQSPFPAAVLEPYMKLMYKASLQVSFEKHIYWYTEDGGIFMVVEGRRICWQETGDSAAKTSKSKWLHDCAPMWRKEIGLSTEAS